MNHPYVSQMSFTKNSKPPEFNKKGNSHLQRSQALPSQYMNYSSQFSTRISTRKQQPNRSLDSQLLRQLTEDYQNVGAYQVNKVEEDNGLQNIIKKQKQINQLRNYQPGLVEGQSNAKSRNSIQGNIKNKEKSIHTNKNKITQEPESFRDIQQCDTLGEESDQYPSPQRSKSVRNLMKISQAIQNQLRNSLEMENPRQRKFNHKPRDIAEELQQKAIFQNFRNSDLKFLSDHQFLPQGMYQSNFTKKSVSNKNSKQSETNHPFFRETVNYVDGQKLDLHERFAQYHRQGRILSEESSQQSVPLTNYDKRQNYIGKYKRYKKKYMNAVDVIRQLEKLNESLIKDQRQNFRYYEDTIRNLQNMLITKDREIEQLNNFIMQIKLEQQRKSNVSSSIQGRQLEVQNRKLKKQLDTKDKEINSLKQNLQGISSAPKVTETTIQGQSKNLQKKNDFLKKEKQAFQKKIKSLEELNKTYEQKIKDKEERINKLSEMNTDLQEEVMKLKGKITSDETYDTEREFGASFGKKTSKQQHLNFSCQTFNKFPINNSNQKSISNLQIEKYVACIDQQLRLILSSLVPKEGAEDKDIGSLNHLKKRQLSELDLVSQFQFEDSIQRTNEKVPIRELQNVVQKLNNFRASMGV